MKNKLMTHVVAGYPTEPKCIELMLGMQAAGIYAIEVQIPFSDPGADGPTIMKANDIALDNGMTTKGCFKMIKSARKLGFSLPVYVMSYANKLYRYGFDKFCKDANDCQASGFIVPDLPYDSPEFTKLSKQCSRYNLEIVPVLSPGVSAARLSGYKIEAQKIVYLTSTKGITGKELAIKRDVIDLVGNIRSVSKCEIALGFGIRNKQDVTTALGIADIAVIGSEVIREVEQNGVTGAVRFIKNLVDG